MMPRKSGAGRGGSRRRADHRGTTPRARRDDRDHTTIVALYDRLYSRQVVRRDDDGR